MASRGGPQGAKGLAHLDTGQVTCWTSWHLYTTLADNRPDLYCPLRVNGARQYARERGAPDPVAVPVPLDRRGTVDALTPALTDWAVPTGIACYNDEVAIAVVAAARELDLDVPQQVAVVGADHIVVGQLVSPRLTTVRIHLPAMVSAFISATTTPAPQGRTSVPSSPLVYGETA